MRIQYRELRWKTVHNYLKKTKSAKLLQTFRKTLIVTMILQMIIIMKMKRGVWGEKQMAKKRVTEVPFSVREFNLPVVKNRITFAPV